MKQKKTAQAKRLPDTSSAKHTRHKKKEFSKWYLVAVSAVMLALIVVIVHYAYSHDSYYSTPLTTLAELWCGVLSLCIGFYFWKAKTENCKKYAQEFFKTIMKDLCERYGPERAAPLIEALSNYTRAITDGK